MHTCNVTLLNNAAGRLPRCEFRHWHCDLFGDEGQHFGPRRLVDVQETARKTNSREPAWMARMTVARATVDHKILNCRPTTQPCLDSSGQKHNNTGRFRSCTESSNHGQLANSPAWGRPWSNLET